MAKIKQTTLLEEGKFYLFYQIKPENGYWAKYLGPTKNGIYKYNTKLGAFKNFKICTYEEYCRILAKDIKRMPEKG